MLMNARPVYDKIIALAKKDTDKLRKSRVEPTLAAILTADDETSKVYVDMKRKDCASCGIKSEVYEAYKAEKEKDYQRRILALIKKLNGRDDVHGILIQLPLSPKLDEEKVFEALDHKKDVDSLTPYNLGKIMRGEYDNGSLVPCTPKGIMRLIDNYKIEIEGKDAVIIGRSFLVGEPLRKLLQDRDATVTCVHSKTHDISEIIQTADIVVSAVGRPPELYGGGFRLTKDMLKRGSVVIGVGVRKDKGKMLFDVDVDGIKGRASFITPNIGGVGLMTRACLIENTLIAAKDYGQIRA